MIIDIAGGLKSLCLLKLFQVQWTRSLGKLKLFSLATMEWHWDHLKIIKKLFVYVEGCCYTPSSLIGVCRRHWAGQIAPWSADKEGLGRFRFEYFSRVRCCTCQFICSDGRQNFTCHVTKLKQGNGFCPVDQGSHSSLLEDLYCRVATCPAAAASHFGHLPRSGWWTGAQGKAPSPTAQ